MPNKPQHRLSVGFWRTLWQLLVLLRPFPALFLVLLSVIEAVLVSKGIQDIALAVSEPVFAPGKLMLRHVNLQLVKLLASTTSSLLISSTHYLSEQPLFQQHCTCATLWPNLQVSGWQSC